MSVETDKDGNSKTLYYHYGANRLVAQEEAGGEYLIYHFNNVGSTTAVTNADGTIKYRYQYSPYGELIEGSYGAVV